jgi:hypothetical protein
LIMLKKFDDVDAYVFAIEQFERRGDRCALMERLMALGLSASLIRWHAEFPGRKLMAVACE